MKKVLLLGWSFVLFTSSAVAAEVVCADKSGKLTLRHDVCKKNERIIPFNVPGPQGAKGEDGMKGLRGEPGLPGEDAVSVYDAAEKKVGSLVGLGCDDGVDYVERAWVITQLGNKPHLACVDRNGFVPRFTFYFEGPNCTGAAYVDGGVYNYSQRSSLVPRALADTFGNAYAVGNGSLDTTVRSKAPGQGSEPCAELGSTNTSLIPTVFLGATSAVFTPPLSVK